MTRTQISIDGALYRNARIEARRRGISFSELCRRALARELPPAAQQGEKPWMKWAGSVDSGDRDASRSVDEVVYGRERP